MAEAAPEVSSNSNGSTQPRVVLAKPRLGGFSFSNCGASKSSNPLSSVLRPSQLKLGNNPFIKLTENVSKDEDSDKQKVPEKVITVEEPTKEEDTPKFMPLGTSSNVTARTTVPTPAQTSSGFVFGQNLSDRVVINENVNNGEAGPSDHSESNGSTESDLLFTKAAATVKEVNQAEASTAAGEGGVGAGSGAGLAAAAAEYERSHARPAPPPQSHANITGEEDEVNVLQISCRLFAWEAGSWRERGRGVLRLNDAAAGGGSRLVARVAGSLRVVLNTKLWPEMVVELAGTKSLRVTAADAQQQVKLFLIMGLQGDITQLHRALTSRIAVSKKPVTTCAQNSTSHEAAVRLDSDYQEKHDELSDEPATETEPLPEKDDNTQEKSLKRKEPVDDETSPKRQCPKIVIE